MKKNAFAILIAIVAFASQAPGAKHSPNGKLSFGRSPCFANSRKTRIEPKSPAYQLTVDAQKVYPTDTKARVAMIKYGRDYFPKLARGIQTLIAANAKAWSETGDPAKNKEHVENFVYSILDKLQSGEETIDGMLAKLP